MENKQSELSKNKINKEELASINGGDLPQMFCQACGAAVVSGFCVDCGEPGGSSSNCKTIKLVTDG